MKRYIDRRIRDGILHFLAPVGAFGIGLLIVKLLSDRHQEKEILSGELSELEYVDQIKAILVGTNAVRKNPELERDIMRVKTIDGLIRLDQKYHFDPSPTRDLLEKKALFKQARMGMGR